MVGKKAQVSRAEHLLNIKKKYMMEGKYIYLGSIPKHRHDQGLYISSLKFDYLCEIIHPNTLSNYINKIKNNKIMLYHVDDDTVYKCLDDYVRDRMILKLSGIE